jgi:hypothetical protein
VSTSSAQDISSITFDNLDTITLTGAVGSSWDTCGTYTISTSSIPTSSYTYASGMTVGGLSSAQICSISTISVADIKLNWPEEWVNCFPEWSRVEKMCEEYPGLRIAFEKFKTVYALVKDDYDTPKDKRSRP